MLELVSNPVRNKAKGIQPTFTSRMAGVTAAMLSRKHMDHDVRSKRELERTDRGLGYNVCTRKKGGVANKRRYELECPLYKNLTKFDI